MSTTTAIEGLKISDISLLNPPKRIPGSDFKFHVEIELKGEKKTRQKTGKERLEGDRVVWSESICFPGNVIDSVLVMQVYKTRWPNISYSVGSCQKEVGDLLEIQNSNGSCELKIGSKSGRLVFNIEPQSESAILSNAVSGAESASSRIPTMEHSTKVADITTSVHDTFVNQQETWSSFLSQFNVFMTAVDQIAEIHPYAKMAWSVLSAIPKAIIAEKNGNDSVKQLLEKLKETYDFITDAKRLPELRTTQRNALSQLVQQTIECGYFIQEYCRTAKKSLKGKSLDDQINAFIDVFDYLKRVMTNSIAVETSIVTLRVATTVTQIHELELLKEIPYDPKAGFSSKKKCLAGTRENLIQEIIDWVNHETPERMFVLSGAAGTGKSAVAHTIADRFKRQNRLGSLFCFSRSYPDRRDFLFSTISRAIADGDDSWRKNLIDNIQDISIRTSNDPLTQFEELVGKPSKETSTIGPVVIVIDALDESGGPTERKALLDILFRQLSTLPINYRIILTTRPEQDIVLHCQAPSIHVKRMDDIPKEETCLDIQNYVSSRLESKSEILDGIQRNWREVLVQRAEGLFQWAETACLTMDPLYHRSSLRRAWDACTSGTPASLYELYHNIISSQPECEYSEFMDDFRLVVGAIMTAREPLTTDALGKIFEDIVQDVKATLHSFGSLLVGVYDEFTPIRPLHTSLLDFFHARYRDGTNENKYYVDTSDQTDFTLGCLKLMNQALRFNMCNLETSHLRNRDIPNFAKRVEKAIPFHLSYACRFWAFHLRCSPCRKDLLIPQLRVLMQKKLLYWFEALGLLWEMEKGRIGMKIMQNWCKDMDNELADQAADCWQFGYDFGDMIETSTPHLYISALPFTPSNSFISKQFIHTYPLLLKLNMEDGQQFDSAPKTSVKRKHRFSPVSSLVFSPQGQYIATGFQSGEFWFWDYESGEMIYRWWRSWDEGYINTITDIVFSPDGQLVYCCFWTGHIQTLDVKTGEMMDDSHQDILEGWRCDYCTVSSDGCNVMFVISGQGIPDDALLLCDRTSRQKLMQVEASFTRDPVMVFTPNGDMFAFFDRCHGPHLYDIRRRELVYAWTGRCSPNLALSDRHIAFYPDDNIIEVWDIHTLTRVCKVKTDIRSCAGTIRFANDQHLLFYSSSTYTVCDVLTGNVIVEPFPARSRGRDIWSLVASSDLKYIALATGPGDTVTIYVGTLSTPIRSKASDILDEALLIMMKLWMRGRHLVQVYEDTATYGGIVLVSDTMTANSTVFSSQITLGPPYRSRPVIAVSPINDHVDIAFSTTRGLCFWNASEGESVLDKETGIVSLDYSPLGNRLISAEAGTRNRIRIWDVHTRTLVGGPYEVRGAIRSLALSATGENFVVVYKVGLGPASIEVRQCQSGQLLNGPFEFDMTMCISRCGVPANGTSIICICTVPSCIVVLDAVSGENEVLLFNPYIRNPRLSPDWKYVVWLLEDLVELWDIHNRVLSRQLLSNDIVRDFVFSDDSTQITTLYSVDDKYYIDVWHISTGKKVMKGIPTWSINCGALSLNGNHLIFSNQNVPKVLNLNVYEIMSSLYERHKNHSQFGMFPVDNLETRREISTLIAGNEDILKYALVAWDKALFSLNAEISEDGWIFGPHGELLMWVPERIRSTLWRPCMMHIGRKHFTKLNFDKFVHGSRWTECKMEPVM